MGGVGVGRPQQVNGDGGRARVQGALHPRHLAVDLLEVSVVPVDPLVVGADVGGAVHLVEEVGEEARALPPSLVGGVLAEVAGEGLVAGEGG